MYRTEEIYVDNNGDKIYGVAYIPEGDKKFPLVIFSHELGSNNESGEVYAKYFAQKGVAYYCFDFRGGSVEKNKSDGSSMEMSVMTEKSDLFAVLQAAKKWDFVDDKRIILHGASQGGMVSAALAPSVDINGLVLMYPALLIPESNRLEYSTKEDVPEVVDLFGGWMNVGRNYVLDTWDYDVYSEIAKYKGAVLLLHGNLDEVVPRSYSKRAQKAYENARLCVIEDGKHIFKGESALRAIEHIDEFFKEQGMYSQSL